MKWNVILPGAVLLLVPVMSFGAATITALSGGSSSVTVLPGQTIAVDIWLSDVTVGVAGFEARLLDLGTTGKLSIAGTTASAARTWGATFNTAYGDFPLATDVRGVWAPKSKNLGCLAASVPSYGPELYPSILETVQIQVAANTPAGTTFTIRMSDLILADELAGSIPVVAGPDLIVRTSANAPIVMAAVSRKTHGVTGNKDIDVKAVGAVECRSNGPTLVVVTFDQSVQGVGGLDPTDVSLSSGNVSSVSISGSVLTIGMSGAYNADLLVMSFPGISNADGQTVSGMLCFGVLLGDANGDKKVNVFDLQAIKNAVNQPVTTANFRADITASGGINVSDLQTTKNNVNKMIAGWCP